MADNQGPRPDVIVIGAGLAGLACAGDLCGAGLSVEVLEASDAAGGRMRTDRQDGFLLDRGFQVFNTSYPQVKRRVRLRDLSLRPFTPGALVHTPSGRLRFTDPTRRPGAAADLLPGRLAPARDLLALGLLSLRDMFGPVGPLKRRADRTTLTALADAGISEGLTEEFFRPFLSGVLLEDELETSSRFFHLVWRSMLRGTLCLPAAGIGAVPAQLAQGLPPGVLHLGTPVRALTGSGVGLQDGTGREAAAVVVATGARAAAALLPGLDVPPGRTVTTYYHAAAASPLREPTLLVDRQRRFLNTCVLSEVAPPYAPAGRSLISTSLLGRDLPGREEGLREDLADVYGTRTATWELLAARTIEDALPAMLPPWPLSRTSRTAPGRYVCGDHRATGSVQGALASGARAAREVLEDLGRRSRSRA
ncbi:NAD(P)/FAD-dependent oxidoreductase [Streptomyces sp. NBC_00344]|uniref:NAD(P)/FAD-dependent oxidoreductase n=1 Tax=Streptomyces sp. NBC_00344 TaxID=2975720 RepID=UPI002E250050